jgi:hypothetical protein
VGVAGSDHCDASKLLNEFRTDFREAAATIVDRLRKN